MIPLTVPAPLLTLLHLYQFLCGNACLFQIFMLYCAGYLGIHVLAVLPPGGVKGCIFL